MPFTRLFDGEIFIVGYYIREECRRPWVVSSQLNKTRMP